MSSRTLAGGVVHAEDPDDRYRTKCGRSAVLTDLPLSVTCQHCLGTVDQSPRRRVAPLTKRTRMTYCRGGKCC